MCGWNGAVLARVMEIHKERPFSFNHQPLLLYRVIFEAASTDDTLSLLLLLLLEYLHRMETEEAQEMSQITGKGRLSYVQSHSEVWTIKTIKQR